MTGKGAQPQLYYINPPSEASPAAAADAAAPSQQPFSLSSFLQGVTSSAPSRAAPAGDLPEIDGAPDPHSLHRHRILEPYPPMETLQQKRLAARRQTTTYCYDFLSVFENALRDIWSLRAAAGEPASVPPAGTCHVLAAQLVAVWQATVPMPALQGLAVVLQKFES